jgi:hypothetical protein
LYHPEALEPIAAFLRALGIAVVREDAIADSFLPGVTVRAGALHVAPEALAGSGDLLHEAGHIISVPRRFWPRLGANLQAAVEALLAAETRPGEPADPALDHAARNGEFMAQAWSYAVCRHLGLSPGCVFFPGAHNVAAFDGTHPMQRWLEGGTHYGPLHLATAGLTGFSGLFAFMGDNGLAPFPEMARWTLD